MFLKIFLFLATLQKLEQFQSYKKLQNLTFDELQLAVNYICGNLNSFTCYNYHYWYDMYSYTSKTFMVMNWRKERGFKEVGRLGEAVCDRVIVNFLEEKEYFKCSCSSVYYDAVFLLNSIIIYSSILFNSL